MSASGAQESAVEEPQKLRMNQAEYGRSRGFSKQYVGKLVAKGIIALDDDGMLDPLDSDRAREIAADPARRLDDGDGEPGDGRSYQDAKTAEIELRIRREQLNFAREAGQLVDVGDVEAAYRTASRKVRDRMLRIAHEIGGRVAATTDEKECRAIVAAAITSALNDLADDLATDEDT